MEYDVLVAGRPSFDLIFTGLPKWPQPGRESYAQEVTVTAGGAFNAAAAASRLGFRVGFIGMIGNDAWSQYVRQQFAAEGVSTEFLKVLDRPLPAVSVALNVNGDRGFVTHEAEPEETDKELAAHVAEVLLRSQASHLHLHLVCELSSIAEVVRERAMTMSVDAWGWEPWLCSAALRELVPLGDVLMMNEPESHLITGTLDTSRALEQLSRMSPYVVIKRASRGAAARVDGSCFEISTTPAPVVDATGAGDCFNAGFLYGWLRGLPPRACLVLGNLCGGSCVQVIGGYQGCPTERELVELARDAGVRLTPHASRSARNGLTRIVTRDPSRGDAE